MAGYHGFSKSNNAVMAEEMGKYPLSKVTKSHLVDFGISMTLSDAKLLAKHDYWRPSEWHHTSKEYNVTHYYDLEVLKLIEEEGEYQAFLKKIKAETKEKKQKDAEDVFYAKIKVKWYYRSGRRWITEFDEVYAEVRNWNGSSEYCSYNGNRKKKDNIAILKKFSQEEYLKIIAEEKKEHIKKMLGNAKQKAFKEIEKHLALSVQTSPLFETLFSKIKNARTFKSVQRHYDLFVGEREKLERQHKEQLEKEKRNRKEKQKKEVVKLREKVKDGIDLLDWVILPQSVRHPAPKSVMEAKLKSGLGWNAFERELRANTKQGGKL